MDTIIKIIGIAITGTILSVVLKKNTPEFAVMTSIITGLVIFYLIYDSLSYAIAGINSLIFKTGIDSDITGIVFKICAIGIVSEYFCNIISDAGETAIAKKAEIATKIVIFVMTIPIVIKVIDNIFNIF